jgi:hypothetical protein
MEILDDLHGTMAYHGSIYATMITLASPETSTEIPKRSSWCPPKIPTMEIPLKSDLDLEKNG